MMSSILRSLTAFVVVLLLATATGNASAEPTADEYVAQGKTAALAKKRDEALAAFRSAFRLAPSSLNAVRVAIAAAYALPLVGATAEFQTWLRLKRTDATSAGDKEPS